MAGKNDDPVALTQSYVNGTILFPGHVFRDELFHHVKTATTDSEKDKVREALALVPRMKWDDKHRKVLTEKGFIL